jgi:hypothetical protein
LSCSIRCRQSQAVVNALSRNAGALSLLVVMVDMSTCGSHPPVAQCGQRQHVLCAIGRQLVGISVDTAGRLRPGIYCHHADVSLTRLWACCGYCYMPPGCTLDCTAHTPINLTNRSFTLSSRTPSSALSLLWKLLHAARLHVRLHQRWTHTHTPVNLTNRSITLST